MPQGIAEIEWSLRNPGEEGPKYRELPPATGLDRIEQICW